MARDAVGADSPAALPAGTIILWAGDWPDLATGQYPPAGWLSCDGSVCPAAAPELLTLLADSGCPFGGTDAAPWLPNLRSIFVRGAQLAGPPGFDPDAPRDVGSVQEQDITRHLHQYLQFPSGDGPYGTWSVDANSQQTKGPATTAPAGSDETYPTHVCFAHLIKIAQNRQEPPPPVGTVVIYGGGPDAVMKMDGWQICNGDPVTDEHKALKKLLPHAPYLPDVAGLFARGVDTQPASNNDPDRDNTRFRITDRGRLFDAGPLSFQLSALISHSHAINGVSSGDDYADWTWLKKTDWDQQVAKTDVYPRVPSTEDESATPEDTPILEGRESRPRNIALLFIISVGVTQSHPEAAQR